MGCLIFLFTLIFLEFDVFHLFQLPGTLWFTLVKDLREFCYWSNIFVVSVLIAEFYFGLFIIFMLCYLLAVLVVYYSRLNFFILL